MNKIPGGFFFLVCMLIFSCATSGRGAEENISWRNYGSVQYGAAGAQFVDISMPVTILDNAATAMVFIHGLDRREILQDWTLLDNYRDRFIVGNIGYRTAGVYANITMDELLQDVDGAVAAIERTAAENNIHIKNLIMIGYSLGGAMALNYSYMDIQRKHEIPVAFCVSISGITDITDPGFLRFSRAARLPIKTRAVVLFTSLLTGQRITENDVTEYGFNERSVNIVKDFSALYHINEKTPPTIIAHDTEDKIVPYSNSRSLHIALDLMNIPNIFIGTTNKLGHGLGTRQFSSKRKMDGALERALIHAIDTYTAEYCR